MNLCKEIYLSRQKAHKRSSKERVHTRPSLPVIPSFAFRAFLDWERKFFGCHIGGVASMSGEVFRN